MDRQTDRKADRRMPVKQYALNLLMQGNDNTSYLFHRCFQELFVFLKVIKTLNFCGKNSPKFRNRLKKPVISKHWFYCWFKRYMIVKGEKSIHSKNALHTLKVQDALHQILFSTFFFFTYLYETDIIQHYIKQKIYRLVPIESKSRQQL